MEKAWDAVLKKVNNMSKGIHQKLYPEKYRLQNIKNLKGRMTGKQHTEETKQKMRLKALGHKRNLGKKHKLETIEKIRLANIGEKNPMFGKKLSIEHNKKIHKIGVDNYFYGKHHTEETKEKISKSNIGRFVGERNYFWINGKSFELYGREFNNSLKEQIRFREGYKCKICGCSQVENGRQLDIHHIDYDKKNNNFNNLVSLCLSCHCKTNVNREYWKNYFLGIGVGIHK